MAERVKEAVVEDVGGGLVGLAMGIPGRHARKGGRYQGAEHSEDNHNRPLYRQMLQKRLNQHLLVDVRGTSVEDIAEANRAQPQLSRSLGWLGYGQ